MADLNTIDQNLVSAARKDQGQTDIKISEDQKEPITSEAYKNNAFILGNALELITGIIRKIAGNDISNSIGGSALTTGVLQSIVAQHMLKHFKETAYNK